MWGTCQMSPLTLYCSQPPLFGKTTELSPATQGPTAVHSPALAAQHCSGSWPMPSHTIQKSRTAAEMMSPPCWGTPSQVGRKPITGGFSRKHHFAPQNSRSIGNLLSYSYRRLEDAIVEPVGHLQCQHDIHWCWCCPRGSSPAASWAGSRQSGPIFESVTCAFKKGIFHRPPAAGQFFGPRHAFFFIVFAFNTIPT